LLVPTYPGAMAPPVCPCGTQRSVLSGLMRDTLAQSEGESWAWREGLPYWELCRICHMVRWPGDWRSKNGRGSRPCTSRRPQTWHDGCVSLVGGDLGITTVVERRSEPQPWRPDRPDASLPAPPPSGSGSLAPPPLAPPWRQAAGACVQGGGPVLGRGEGGLGGGAGREAERNRKGRFRGERGARGRWEPRAQDKQTDRQRRRTRERQRERERPRQRGSEGDHSPTSWLISVWNICICYASVHRTIVSSSLSFNPAAPDSTLRFHWCPQR
jgi:hypothetical protein